MKDHRLIIPAGGYVEVFERGNLCRVKSAPVNLVVETLDAENRVEMGEGQAFRVSDFTGLRVTNPGASPAGVVLVVGYGSFEDQALSGTVTAQLQQGQTLTNATPVTVTSTAAVLVAGDANRRAFHLRNTGAVPVYLGGAGVTTANAAIVLEPDDEMREASAAAAEWHAVTASGTAPVAVLEVS